MAFEWYEGRVCWYPAGYEKTWMSAPNYTAVHPLVEIFQSGPKWGTDWATDRLIATTRAWLKMHQEHRQFRKKSNKCSCHLYCNCDLYICHYYGHEGHAITCRPASPSSADKHATIVQRYAKQNDKRPIPFSIFISVNPHCSLHASCRIP